MELDRIEFFCFVFCCCYRTVCGVCRDFKSRCNFWDIIEVAHPACSLCRHTLEYFWIFFIDKYFGFSIFSDISTLYFSAKHVWHQLCTITQSKHRNAKFEKFIGVCWRIRLVTAVRPACQDDSLWIHRFDFFNIGFVRINLAIDIAFSYASGNQLVILSTEVQYDYYFFFQSPSSCF